MSIIYNRLEVKPSDSCPNPRNEIGRFLLEVNGRDSDIDLMKFGFDFPVEFETLASSVDTNEGLSRSLFSDPEEKEHAVILWFSNIPSPASAFITKVIQMYPQLEFSWTYVDQTGQNDRGEYGVIVGINGELGINEIGHAGVGQNKYALAHAAVVEPCLTKLTQHAKHESFDGTGDSPLQVLLQTY